jgi:hypothetical protein
MPETEFGSLRATTHPPIDIGKHSREGLLIGAILPGKNVSDSTAHFAAKLPEKKTAFPVARAEVADCLGTVRRSPQRLYSLSPSRSTPVSGFLYMGTPSLDLPFSLFCPR